MSYCYFKYVLHFLNILSRKSFENFLGKQLSFSISRRYTAVNRLYGNYQFALNLEQAKDGYFKLILQSSGKLISAAAKGETVRVEAQSANGDEAQHWYLIPTGEQDYYRIRTRSRVAGRMGFMFLQVTNNGTTQVNLAGRNNKYLGQQWRFI